MKTKNAWNQWHQGQAPSSQPFHEGWPTWMFAGRPCTCREFADMVWAEDTAEKTSFLLKWDGFER